MTGAGETMVSIIHNILSLEVGIYALKEIACKINGAYKPGFSYNNYQWYYYYFELDIKGKVWFSYIYIICLLDNTVFPGGEIGVVYAVYLFIMTLCLEIKSNLEFVCYYF